jgi:hypothetical protein
MVMSKAIYLLALLLIPVRYTEAQTTANWYKNLPERAEFTSGGASTRIGGKTYRVYNAFDPIAPQGGERILDMVGTLDYYMWVHKGPDGVFTISRIDSTFLIYYFDPQIKKYITLGGKIMEE